MAEDVRQSALLSCGDAVIVNPHRCLVRTHGDVIPRLIVVRWNAEVIQVIDRIVELKQFTHATKVSHPSNNCNILTLLHI